MLRIYKPQKTSMYLFTYLVVICNCVCVFGQGFTEPSKLKKFNITVNFESYTVKTQMLNQNKKISVDNGRLYMWYTSQKILETRGGYDGKLIHGTYRSFYLNNQLREKGEVNYGLKNKEWKYWYADGKLKEVITWKNGEKNGSYYLYNDYGQLMAKSKFKKDKLHGNFYTYNASGKILDKKKYKNGDEQVPKLNKKKQGNPKELNKKNKPSPGKKKNKEPRKVKNADDDLKTRKQPLLKRLFKKNAKEKEQDIKPSPVIITS